MWIKLPNEGEGHERLLQVSQIITIDYSERLGFVTALTHGRMSSETLASGIKPEEWPTLRELLLSILDGRVNALLVSPLMHGCIVMDALIHEARRIHQSSAESKVFIDKAVEKSGGTKLNPPTPQVFTPREPIQL